MQKKSSNQIVTGFSNSDLASEFSVGSIENSYKHSQTEIEYTLNKKSHSSWLLSIYFFLWQKKFHGKDDHVLIFILQPTFFFLHKIKAFE